MVAMVPPSRVARRALALTVFKYRATYEDVWVKPETFDREEMVEEVADMAAMLGETGLIAHLSEIERGLFAMELGRWHFQDVREMSWRGEALLVLVWALGRVDRLPPIHEQSVGVHFELESQCERIEEFAAEATLRSEDELEQMEGYVQSVRLRAQTPDDFEGIPWLAGKAEGFGGEPPVEGDLPIGGRPFREVGIDVRNDVNSIALERHRALYWLLEYEEDLDARAPEV